MARKDRINEKNLDNLRNKSSAITYGVDEQLYDENIEVRNIIQQTIIDTKKKLGERTNEKPINYFNEINFGNAFNEIFVDTKNKKESENQKLSNAQEFKKYMTNNNQIDIGALMAEDAGRTVLFNNYRIIHQHIPECAQALQIYKDNIMSPDDYTKLIFNVNYEKPINEDSRKLVKERTDNIRIKYDLENKADKIIEETLELGESYYAVLSLEEDLSLMLSDPVQGFQLNESTIRTLDPNTIDMPVLSENIKLNDLELDALNECLGLEENLNEETASQLVAKFVNENVIIGSSKELLLEKIEADKDKNKNDIPNEFYKEKRSVGRPRKNINDKKPMYLNGSALRYLKPEKIVELKIDNICYGYYYAEEVANNIPTSSYLGHSNGRNANGIMSLAQNSTISGSTQATYSPASSAAAQLGIGEAKLKIISNMFLNTISKKIDKDFIRNNKEFKDFIYDLVRQDYIIKKGLKLTYFKPDEVIKFEAQPVYKDITFFAKLYLSILTNNLLIKLGRAHDKRVFYVNVGADGAYEQAIQSVIEDVKTKDYKMENLNDFNTVLNLAPGRFDDYFMPTINGERPVEIDTLAGMDVDMNNEFVEYLKNSMMSGMGVPRNLIDVTSEVDYARSVSAMNANFVRSVIKYQKNLTPPFTRLYQKLYENEYKYQNDQEANHDSIDIDSIRVQFPSPATLSMTAISEQIASVDQNADFIASQIVPPRADGLNEDERIKLKTMIVKDLLPSIDWEKYEKMKDDMKREVEKEKITNPPPADPMAGGMDPYSGMGGY